MSKWIAISAIVLIVIAIVALNWPKVRDAVAKRDKCRSDDWIASYTAALLSGLDQQAAMAVADKQ